VKGAMDLDRDALASSGSKHMIVTALQNETTREEGEIGKEKQFIQSLKALRGCGGGGLA
jgi:hypothetical protein